jgi:hypothetical protein
MEHFPFSAILIQPRRFMNKALRTVFRRKIQKAARRWRTWRNGLYIEHTPEIHVSKEDAYAKIGICAQVHEVFLSTIVLYLGTLNWDLAPGTSLSLLTSLRVWWCWIPGWVLSQTECCLVGTGILSPVINRPDRELGHSLQSIDKPRTLGGISPFVHKYS